MNNQATAGGRNPFYEPREDAIAAIAEHLADDDTAYEDREEAERQARRIVAAIEQRGLQILESRSSINPLLAEIARLCNDAPYVGDDGATRRSLDDWAKIVRDLDQRLVQILRLAEQLDAQLADPQPDTKETSA